LDDGEDGVEHTEGSPCTVAHITSALSRNSVIIISAVPTQRLVIRQHRTKRDKILYYTMTDRHHRLTRNATPGSANSLWEWTDAKPVWVVVSNYILIMVARLIPSLRARNWALRRLGAHIGTGVSWGLEATPDVFWPELITIKDDAIIGYDAVLLCHEFLQDEYRTGEIVIGREAMIGAKAVILPGVHIGEEAQVAANSLVTRDVPPETTVGGVPAEQMTNQAGSDAAGS